MPSGYDRSNFYVEHFFINVIIIVVAILQFRTYKMEMAKRKIWSNFFVNELKKTRTRERIES